jgi:hypothetical protein
MNVRIIDFFLLHVMSGLEAIEHTIVIARMQIVNLFII